MPFVHWSLSLHSAGAASVEVERLKAKLSAATAQASKLEGRLAEKAELLAEKEAHIAAVLEEGERLSVRQAEQEKLKKANVGIRKNIFRARG